MSMLIINVLYTMQPTSKQKGKEVGLMRDGHSLKLFGLIIGRKRVNIRRGDELKAFQKSKVQNLS